MGFIPLDARTLRLRRSVGCDKTCRLPRVSFDAVGGHLHLRDPTRRTWPGDVSDWAQPLPRQSQLSGKVFADSLDTILH